MDQRKRMRARPHRLVSAASLALAALLLAGCSSTPDWANPVEWYHGVSGWFGDDDPETEAARARAKANAQKTPPGPYPNLSTVPERPKDISNTSQANRVQKGLIADRSNARYTEMELTPPPPVPPAPSGALSPMTAAPSAPAQPPVTAVPSAPLQAEPLPRAAEPPVAETSRPSSGAAPAADAPPMPAGPPPQAELPVPESAGRTPDTSQSAKTPPAATNQGDAMPPAPPGKMAALPPSAAKAPAPSGTQVGTVLFADNSSKVSESYDKLLHDIVSITKEKGGILRVVGHASPGAQGADALKQRVANFRVSLARANAVARELVRLGVPARNVMVEGRADNEPLYPESAPGGDAGNRRAEIYIDYPKGRR